VIRAGVIGWSEGNGHPFSYSAIINGFDDGAMKRSGWPGIHAYLREKDPAEFGFPDLKITHVWTQDPDVTQQIARSARIGARCRNPEEMVGEVDAIFLLRDDHETHLEMARPFLERGIRVFIDKPLTLSLGHLSYFSPYLATGQLMSCAGLRYARELDGMRQQVPLLTDPLLVRGTVCGPWDKYGIHLIDGLMPMIGTVEAVRCIREGPVTTAQLSTAQGCQVTLQCLLGAPKTFLFEAWSPSERLSAEVTDNFTAFRRTIAHFRKMVLTGEPPYDPQTCIDTIKILIAGERSIAEKREVRLHELEI
jgi:predicted dehydrogenase